MPTAFIIAIAVASIASAVAGAEQDAVTGATPRHHREATTAAPPLPEAAPAVTPRPPDPALSVPAPSVRRVLCVSRTRRGREFFEVALAAKDVELTVGGPELLPGNLKGLIPYDCVVLSNIPRASLGDAKMRMLVRYVRDYGGGLVVLGGPGSLGPAYKGTPLDELLPVTMDGVKRFGKGEALPLCLVFVMDKSGSMGIGWGAKITAARAAAEALVSQLRHEDMLGIIAFDFNYRVLVPLDPVGDHSKEIIDLIRRVEPGGDTRIGETLEEALQQFGDSQCRVKHVILVTDGKTKDLTQYDYRGLVRDYVQNGVTISAVWLEREHGGDFLRALATGTGGDYYQVKDVSALPLTVLKDVRQTMMESGLMNESVVPKPGEKSAILKGIGRGQVPEVKGYIVMAAKPGADVALYSDVRGTKDPLLAAWQRGHGKTVAWTSDAEGTWAGGVASAKKSAAFWSRLVRWSSRGHSW